MTSEQATAALNALTDGDPERAHAEADAILLAFLRANGNGEVADAWHNTSERIGFWYA